MTRTISNSDLVIDSRDVIARIKELEEDRQALVDARDEAFGVDGEAREAAEDALTDWDAGDEGDELKALKALADEAKGCGDWEYGATLVHEDYWVDYVQELLQDVGDLPRGLPGYLVIDWEKTADNIAADYNQVQFGGVTYYVRD